MKVSVIIPTHNAGDSIATLLATLQSQDLKPSEILVIDSSSEDNTIRVSKEFGAETIVIPKKTFNHGKARNIAASKAVGDIFVFMTQDALPLDNTLLTKLTEPLQKSEIAATFGRQIPRHDASPLEIFARNFNYPDTGSTKGIEDIKNYGIKTFFFSNVCSSFKKNLFFRAGMFPEDIISNEDMFITAKLVLEGYKITYVPEAKVIHSHNLSLLQQFKRHYNIGSSFKNNSWIFKYARPEQEGLMLIKKQLHFVIKQRRYLWIPYIFIESFIKYAGYRIGLIKG